MCGVGVNCLPSLCQKELGLGGDNSLFKGFALGWASKRKKALNFMQIN
jgi:hypothetical protein